MNESLYLPGSMVFLRPGGLLQSLDDRTSTLVTFRMMTFPCLVLSVTNRMFEGNFDISRGHILLIPNEGIHLVAGDMLMGSEEMMDAVYVRYGQRQVDGEQPPTE